MKSGQDSSSVSFPIVAIGASAGGLNALECFVGEVPREFGCAVVFVQHLSTKHKSLLPDLLHKRRPDLRVVEISDGQKLFPGKLFLTPPGMEVTIQDGAFRVRPLSRDHIHFPIDEFFTSLAEDAGEQAIAVVFSGAGTDGARGVEEIRNKGGSVFVQDPATAEFPSMPLAAINTGRADSVLPPAEIARDILRLQGAKPAIGDKDITPSQFETFARLVREKAGYSFAHYKKSVVSRRVRRRMYLRDLDSVDGYITTLSEDETEAANLASDLMIGVTSFFRDRLAWKALKMEVIRKLVASDEEQPVRIWTPACATGEEAYSIAMMLRHELDLAGKMREVQVFATDVNDVALEKGREGRYPGSISADVPQEYMRRFFSSADDGLSAVIAKEVRESVVFAKQDLLTDPPFSRLDLIICRNLLIYLEPDAQERCIALFHYALKDGGYLFLGSAETPGRKSVLFRSLSHKKCRIYQKIETKHTTRLSLSVPFATERSPVTPSRAAMEYQQDVAEFVQQSLLEESGPPAVAVNQRFDIVYNNGPTNKYLRQPRGALTQNLLDLMPESLRSRIRGALYRAAEEDKPISLRAVLPKGEKKGQVTLRISKLRDNLFLVVFRERKRGPEEQGELASGAASDESAVHQLESELSATRAELQSNIEQLKSLNEELQSSNEELQAANEELETSREELQSLNEELITVNAQLQSKIEEQEETNDDLNNFLSSTNIPTIFLDHEFRVKRFTPAMSRLLKLIPSDVGRPIMDMSQESLGPDLIADARKVLEGLVPVKQEITIDGSWYIRTSLPYRTADNRIEGVVITYGDVSDLKLAEERTRHLASFPEINPNPVLEVDSSGKVLFANPATEVVLEGCGMDKKDISLLLPSDIEDILRDLRDKKEESLYREVIIKDRVFGETVYLSQRFNVVRIYSYDITEIKKAEQVRGHLAAIVESADDAIISKDLKGFITTWNVGAEKIFGYTAKEAIGKHVSFLVPPGQTDNTQEILRRIADGEHIERSETEHARKDGVVIPVSLTFSAIKDADGRIIGASKIIHDISARKRAEKQLVRAKDEWERTFASVPDMIALIDNDHTILRVNESMAKRLGSKPEECVGRKCYEIVHGTAAPPDSCPHSLTIKEGTGHVQELHEGRLGADLLVTTTPLLDDQGKMIGSVHVAHDITGRKQAEEEVRRHVEELRETNEELARFNQASVGRELRMIELKKEINELCIKAGLPERYQLDFEKDDPTVKD